MELTDLPFEEKRKVANIMIEGLDHGDKPLEIIQQIISHYPKLVYLNEQRLIDFTNAYLAESDKQYQAKKQYLDNLKAYYLLQKQVIADKFNLTLDEVEEINERFKHHRWTALPPIFRLIVAWWKLKRLFNHHAIE